MDKFINKTAKFHKACKNHYDSYHYERATKRKRTRDSGLEQSSSSTVKTRSKFSAKNFVPTCFLCDAPDLDCNLTNARTLGLSQRVQEAAAFLCDEKLLAKLSEGDMVAKEARYHKSCLTSLYNRFPTESVWKKLRRLPKTKKMV